MNMGIDVMLYGPTDAAKVCGCVPSTIKRVAHELRLTSRRNIGGQRVFTEPEVQRIKTGLARRQVEVTR